MTNKRFWFSLGMCLSSLSFFGSYIMLLISASNYQSRESTGKCPDNCFRTDDCSFYDTWADDYYRKRHEGYVSGPCQCAHVNSDGSIYSSCAQFSTHKVIILRFYIMLIVASIMMPVSLFASCSFVSFLDAQNEIEKRKQQDLRLSVREVNSPLHLEEHLNHHVEHVHVFDVENGSAAYSPIHLDILPANTPLPCVK